MPLLIKAQIVIMSHLSDAQHLIGETDLATMYRMYNHINFAKYILTNHHDTTVDIDADEWWKKFTETKFYRK